MNRRQEILDLLADGMTESAIFRRFRETGLQASKPTFHRAIKALKAEQQVAALPLGVSKARPPKVSEQRSSSTGHLATVVQEVSEEDAPSSRSSLKTETFHRPDPSEDQEQFWGK